MSESCGCKGIRSCLLCEGYSANQRNENEELMKQDVLTYEYCHVCKLCWPCDEQRSRFPVCHLWQPFFLKGISVVNDVLSEIEQEEIVRCMDKIPWMLSQSGRRKQDFGPRVNFKRRKVKCDSFHGFPPFAETVLTNLAGIPQLTDFRAVELCNLEYCVERGSAIDPHIDDVWLWGERLLTVNLLSSTVLTLTPAEEDYSRTCGCIYEWKKRSNFSFPTSDRQNSCAHFGLLKSYCDGSSGNGTEKGFSTDEAEARKPQSPTTSWEENGNLSERGCSSGCPSADCDRDLVPVVRIRLPVRSLLVLSSCARYHWLHGIRRSDISSRRIAMTLRELSTEFLEGGSQWETGKKLFALAQVNRCFSP